MRNDVLCERTLVYTFNKEYGYMAFEPTHYTLTMQFNSAAALTELWCRCNGEVQRFHIMSNLKEQLHKLVIYVDPKTPQSVCEEYCRLLPSICKFGS